MCFVIFACVINLLIKLYMTLYEVDKEFRRREYQKKHVKIGLHFKVKGTFKNENKIKMLKTMF